ncbi:MAG: UDP-N-acetylmuramate dehydrogenase [Chlorobi bacterium]|nr:UDP-N-acetylmuramate dehydrogenase [Chlorobiota bacterium]
MLVRKNYNLKSLNTFGVDARAKRLMIIENFDDLTNLTDSSFYREKPVFFMGQGSNVLFVRDFPGVIVLNRLMGREVVEEDDDHVFLRVNAGESWTDLVDYTVGRGWGGLENMSLIPGTVGAAPVQNIGAYGVELKDVLDCVEVFDLRTGNLEMFSVKQCKLGYRTSIFKTDGKKHYLVTSIVLKLNKMPEVNIGYKALREYFTQNPVDEITIRDVSEAVKAIRRSKLPDASVLGSAGSFFKNPVVSAKKAGQLLSRFPGMPAFDTGDRRFKLAAGWLIEQCGWKGRREGDTGVYEKQALVLVNYGNATGKQIYDLSQRIVESVHEKFDILLEREVTVV